MAGLSLSIVIPEDLDRKYPVPSWAYTEDLQAAWLHLLQVESYVATMDAVGPGNLMKATQDGDES